MSKLVHVNHEIIESFMRDVFAKLGVPRDEAELVARVLITSDLRGIESHGVGRLKYYYDRIKRGQHEVITKVDVLKDTPTTAVLDGNHGMGHVVAHRAMSMAIEKAREYGIGAVSVRNSTHFGIAGYYVLMAVEAGMIGLTCTNARPAVAPTFGVKPMLGTNPLTFGIPTDEEFPFVLDCATSIIQRGKIEINDRADKPTPPGYVVGPDGEYLTDSHQMLEDFSRAKAALLALGGKGEEFGGHKGYGYSTTVELLSAVLSGGSFLWQLVGLTPEGEHTRFRVGHFFMAINPEFFMGLETCRKTAGAIVRELRNSPREPGQERIYTAGEKEFLAEKRVREQGVPINEGLQAEIKFVQRELGLDQYDFGF
ncbi:MAG: Ldh family oxidoreductase [Promethearchaeota archaeon]